MSLSTISSIISMDSMRGRYFVGVLLMSVLFIASVLATHVSVSDVVKQAADNSAQRNQLINAHRLVREKLRYGEQRLQIFLLTPDPTILVEVLNALDQASHYLADIENNQWSHAAASLEKINLLSKDLRQLRQDAQRLMQIRTDAVAYVPDLATSDPVMSPRGGQFLTQAKLIMDVARMNDLILPLNERIWLSLNQIEAALIASAESDTRRLLDISAENSSTLWVRLILTLLLIVLAFYGFELWLLEPVAKIAHALKMEADGNDAGKLPEANTLEARELVSAFETMRSQVRLRQMELEHQAMHDSLTGLPNRLFLRRKMIQVIKSSRKARQSLALLMIDLNRFKEINDTLGHHVGDRILHEIGPRFSKQLGRYDVLARLGGDEFAVLLPMSDDIRARQIAQRLCVSLQRAFNIDGQALQVCGSIGIALFPQHGFNDQTLLQKAGVAMYLAKEKNLGYALYDESQDVHSLWQLSLEGELKQAMEQDKLELHYQPKISCSTGKTIGVEALLRWNHPVHGLIPADEIQLLAEKTGLIIPLTKWVMECAVAQMANWRQKDIELLVSVNLSVWNLQDPRLYETVTHALRKWSVPASSLTLEITETAVMSDPDHALKTLNQLSRLGVHLSIDDFGIGFSSLQYLKKLPVNELKIDKSFVIDMLVDDNDAMIVHSTIDLAHNLGLLVTAEGVENQELFDLLQVLGSDIAQGFHMSPAMGINELDSWLISSKWGLPEHRRVKIVN